MVHSDRPLQEKMTLFWHNHFATAYSKVAGFYGAAEGTRYMAAKASEDPDGVRGQIEMLRDNALGNFRDLLVTVAQDVAMLEWLDGRQNTRTRPQENFGRELMELFTMGVGQLHRGRRLRGRARLHRLEPDPAREPAAAEPEPLPVQLQRGAARPHRKDVHASRSIRTAGRRSRPARPPTACRTVSI